MNKKAYISPVIEVTRLIIGRHLCIGSTDSNNPTEGLDDDDDLINGGDNPGSFSRRGRNQWDDDEEEEKEYI